MFGAFFSLDYGPNTKRLEEQKAMEDSTVIYEMYSFKELYTECGGRKKRGLVEWSIKLHNEEPYAKL